MNDFGNPSLGDLVSKHGVVVSKSFSLSFSEHPSVVEIRDDVRVHPKNEGVVTGVCDGF